MIVTFPGGTHILGEYTQAPGIYFVMLNSTEHEFQLLIKSKIPTNKDRSCFNSLRFSFIMLVNVKMPTSVGI